MCVLLVVKLKSPFILAIIMELAEQQGNQAFKNPKII